MADQPSAQSSREFPIPGPHDPQLPPADDLSVFVFPTWRSALKDAHDRIADAYEKRARMFRAAHDAGLSYRDIAEATGLSAAAVGKVLGKAERVTLDTEMTGTP